MKKFSDILCTENETIWNEATNHRFVTELFDGSIEPTNMAAYLIQDHRFLENFLSLLGAAIASADTFAARLRFGQFAGMVAGEENTYFERAFEAVGVSADEQKDTPDTDPTKQFKAIMLEAAATRSYAAILAVLNVAEGLYLDWAIKAPKPLPSNFVHAEWITLHDNPDFRSFVAFLKSEIDRVGLKDQQTSRDFFSRAVKLELAFFDSVYVSQDHELREAV